MLFPVGDQEPPSGLVVILPQGPEDHARGIDLLASPTLFSVPDQEVEALLHPPLFATDRFVCATLGPFGGMRDALIPTLLLFFSQI